MAGRDTSALSLDADSCLRWLDAKPARSVVYVSFGTLSSFSPAELHQLARGLDLSGMNFLWVMGAALFIGVDARRNQPALCGFLTHCGWNSVLEAVSAGVPMVTWPRHADQFNNQMLIVELLKMGVGVGAKDYGSSIDTHEVIGGEVIAESIGRLMESDAIQKKAKDLAVMARSAVENGESSYDAVGRLMDELMVRRSSVKVGQDIQTAS